ncbi:efflux RND transporter periplasmic adaptor subunit [Ktedonobacteria bacterium brp13]|nr:efflux RND transporter periplasmic adaptor subunit [Ktedonobacteria bacterium brp13]
MDEKRSAILHDPYYDTSLDAANKKNKQDSSSASPDNRQADTIHKVEHVQNQKKGAVGKADHIEHNTNESQTPIPATTTKPKKSMAIRIQTFKCRSRRSQLMILAITLASILLIGSIIYTAWFMFNPTPPITAFVVGQTQQVPQNVSGFGPVASQQQSNVTFAAPGHIAGILVKPGDIVTRGTPVIKLDPSQLQAQIDLAANNVDARHAYLNAVSSAIPYNAVVVAAAQQNYVVAQNQYHALMVQTNFNSLHNSDLISQINGVVMQISVNAGDSFAANENLMVIADQSSVIVDAKLPLDVRQYVHNNDPVDVNALGLHDINLQGTITAIIPQVDPQTDSFTVEVTIPNPGEALWSGMNAYVHIRSEVNAFAVPRICVLNPDQESAVYTIRNGRVYMQQVHVIGSSPDGNQTYVDAGLTAGEKIVVLPLNRMHEGLPINIGTIEH